MKDDNLIGENALTSDEFDQIIAQTLEDLKAKGITTAVLAVMVDDGSLQHSNQNYFGGYFAAKGLLLHAQERLFRNAAHLNSEEDQ
jgi:hypothetical protein